MGCSPWGQEESDMTERLHFHFSLLCIGEGDGNPLQCSCLENPRDGGAWWAAIYGVVQSQTRLKRLNSSNAFIKSLLLDFLPESLVVKTLRFHCRGQRCDPWSRNEDPACLPQHGQKKVYLNKKKTCAIIHRKKDWEGQKEVVGNPSWSFPFLPGESSGFFNQCLDNSLSWGQNTSVL